MQTIKKILIILSPAERKRAGLVLVMILIMAFLDMLGVASIMPFVAVLANPELVETNAILNAAYNASQILGVSTVQEFIFVLGIMVFVMLFVSLSFKASTVYVQARFSLMREYSIGKRLVEGYLQKPYSWFLTRNSADLGKNILSEVNLVVANVLIPIMNIIAQSAVSMALLLLLIIVDPMLALTIILVLGLTYSLIFKVTKKLLSRIGKERLENNEARYVAVNEAFGAAKEVKIGGLERFYTQRFAVPAQSYAKNLATANIIGQLPRFALELIVFGGMLLVILILMNQNGSFTSAVPVISLYAFAGYRMMPSLQGIYTSVSQLRFAVAALDALLVELTSIEPESISSDKNSHKKALPLMQDITLNNVTYHYPNTEDPAIKNINLTIAAKSTVGLVGSTGGGKTTTVDLILGLLRPQQGTLEIDGQVINDKNRKDWQSSIGYVPQHIYLADDSVEANIAFGVAPEDIDQVAVERAAKIADLHDFVIKKLPNQYKTKVGERGVRLSGGQRQRIGIARALYLNPQVLVLDEATSALDNLTEQAVMKAVHNLGQEITVIMIAHRLSTIKECDTIFFLENGELTGQGSFNELIQSNERFMAMNKT
jgi:ATP-binding cassette, subfamily B, bacterial PglK